MFQIMSTRHPLDVLLELKRQKKITIGVRALAIGLEENAQATWLFASGVVFSHRQTR